MSVAAYYLGWPHGQIWANLAASLLCVGPAWWKLHAQAITHQCERLALAERHHCELKAHITATVTAAVRQQKRLAPRPGTTPSEMP